MTRKACVFVGALAALALGLSGCAQPMSRSQKGAAIGAVSGAAAGALVGQAAGRDTKATLIGAGIGAAVGTGAGAGIGYYMDRQEEALRTALASVEGVQIERVGDELHVTFRSDNQFDVGSFSLRPAAQQDVVRLAQVLTQYHKTRLLIAGYTDSSGSEELNQQLSERRAAAVRNILLANGVADSRMTVVGFGESAPVADNTSDYGRQLNRRVELKISPL
ncbi:OmpA family protein [Desulfuromonas thiophila]|uniref:Outer membrane protein OmpA n=1 Tax=Desulfuromonas thiophila TaxID=57664 RepID=A0A1G7CB60_9BACT|nr:OmpA family protein [Desulfuromonas thiophila]SDE36453.1 Outer membrane protein OmpA [Desulfuromonas thiophila]